MSPSPQLRRTLLRLGRTLAFAALAAGAVGGARAARWDDPAIGLPLLRTFTTRDTGSLSPNRCALATRQGRLLLGQDGLLSFDGETWQALPIPAGHAVRCLDEDEAGRVWVAGDSLLGFLTFAPDGSIRFTSALDRLPSEQRAIGGVRAIFALPQNTVVAVTENRVIRLQAAAVQVWSLPAPHRLSAWRDSDGTVFIAQPETATLRMGEGGLEPAGFPEPFARAGLEWRVRFADGHSLGSAGGRLIGDHDNQWAEIESPAATILEQDRSTGAVALPGGFAAIATDHHGVLIVDSSGRSVATLDQESGLPSNRIVHLATGSDTCLTITTPEGVAVLCGELLASCFDHRHGLRHNHIQAIARGPSGLFAGTEGATYHLAPRPGEDARPGQWHPEPGPFSALRQLLPLPGRLLGVGTSGLSLLDGSAPLAPPQRSGEIIAASTWSGTPGGIAWVDGTRFFRGTFVAGILQPATAPVELGAEICGLVEDVGGAHWLSTRHSGILRIAPPEAIPSGKPAVRTYRTNVGVTGAELPRVLRVGERILTTNDGGLALYTEDGDRFVPYPGIVNARIHAASATEPDGTVWLAVSQRDRYPFQTRIARLQPEAQGISCELVQLPLLPLGESPTALFAEPGATPGSRVFWLGLPGRILRIETSGALATNPPATPSIDTMTVIDPDHEGQGFGRRERRIAFDNLGVRFDVTVPGGRLGQRVHLECRLPETDPTWVPLGEIPSRVFRGLRDRTYHFEARSIDALGRPSLVANLEFTVLPPWWRSAPAYTSYALGLVLISALVFFTRLRLARAHRSELEALVELRTRELAAANAAKSDFLAHINHEIRNPLNGVVGLSEMLANRHQDEGSRQLARALKACAGYLGSVVDNVLDLARIEAGRIEISTQRFEPRLLIEDIAEMFRMQIEETGGRVACTADPELPRVLVGDVHRIRQVLVNYTANAARYARGGAVRLTVRRRTQADNRVEVVFTVADTGPGIAPEEQARLFEKFARGSTTAASGAPRGYGVGLALVRDLAELLGGHADVDSSLGHGAKFRLTVPLEIAAPEQRAHPVAPGPKAPALRVLVIDDQAFNRLVLRDHLERLGCNVEEASDGTSAHLLLQARAHHLAFVDLDLPGLDGMAVMRRVRQEGGEHGVFLVATTASATRGIEEAVREAGAHAFLPKPIALPRLAALLAECAARQGRPEAAPAQSLAGPPRIAPVLPSLPLSGLFAEIPLTIEMLRQLHAELDVETLALSESWRQADPPAARRHAHRIASLGILAHDDALLQAARRAEESLQQNRHDTQPAIEELELNARRRLRQLGDTVAAARKDANN
ncbi:MAG: response regulator [Opitutaceae bacterium]|nr:response regulator [Opitutaceae bacterium]